MANLIKYTVPMMTPVTRTGQTPASAYSVTVNNDIYTVYAEWIACGLTWFNHSGETWITVNMPSGTNSKTIALDTLNTLLDNTLTTAQITNAVNGNIPNLIFLPKTNGMYGICITALSSTTVTLTKVPGRITAGHNTPNGLFLSYLNNSVMGVYFYNNTYYYTTTPGALTLSDYYNIAADQWYIYSGSTTTSTEEYHKCLLITPRDKGSVLRSQSLSCIYNTSKNYADWQVGTFTLAIPYTPIYVTQMSTQLVNNTSAIWADGESLANVGVPLSSPAGKVYINGQTLNPTQLLKFGTKLLKKN